MNLLIDGSSLLWRSHFTNKGKEMQSVGSDIYMFLKCVKSYAKMYNSKDIYIAWDKKLCNEKNFRQEDSSCDYKGHRDADEAKKVYESQSEIHKATEFLGCKNMYPRIMEADDVIAWLSKNLEGQNVIITTDGDMIQLIDEKNCVFNPRKKVTIDDKNFEVEMGMPKEHYLPYKAILGDSSDNIEGIPGCGKVYSKRMAKKWVDKEELKEEYIPIIEKNIRLMDLSIGYEIAGKEEVEVYKEQLDNYENLSSDIDKFEEFCKKHEINSILKDINSWKNLFDTPYLFKILNDIDF